MSPSLRRSTTNHILGRDPLHTRPARGPTARRSRRGIQETAVRVKGKLAPLGAGRRPLTRSTLSWQAQGRPDTVRHFAIYPWRMRGRAIRVFLVDGTPAGVRTAELGISTCKAVMAPRVKLAEFAQRDEATRTGVYVLVGPDEKHPGRKRIYVGEGDQVIKRVKSHESSKEFWDDVVCFVSKDQDFLTKAHVRFLEARLLELAHAAKRATVENGNLPEGGKLPEADQAEMEEFLDHIRILLGALGITVFEPASEPSLAAAGSAPDGVLELAFSGSRHEAKAYLKDSEVIVRQGSIAKTEEAQSLSNSSAALRAELIDAGVVAQAPEGLVFKQDYAFPSPSSAAQFLCAAAVNGRIAWKLPDGRTLKDWQETERDD